MTNSFNNIQYTDGTPSREWEEDKVTTDIAALEEALERAEHDYRVSGTLNPRDYEDIIEATRANLSQLKQEKINATAGGHSFANMGEFIAYTKGRKDGWNSHLEATNTHLSLLQATSEDRQRALDALGRLENGWDYTRPKHSRGVDIAALRTALTRPDVPHVPAGYVLVPIECSKEMAIAGAHHEHHAPAKNGPSYASLIRAWPHMLAAAPQPPDILQAVDVEKVREALDKGIQRISDYADPWEIAEEPEDYSGGLDDSTEVLSMCYENLQADALNSLKTIRALLAAVLKGAGDDQ